MGKLGRILLVEDSDNDVTLTLAVFEDCRLANEVVVVRDGQQALDFLSRTGEHAGNQEPDPVVVLLDLKLPKVNGLEVLQKVKADPATRRIPVVVLTSSREESDLLKSYDLGVNAYVVKPVGFDAFASALKELGLFWALLNQTPASAPA